MDLSKIKSRKSQICIKKILLNKNHFSTIPCFSFPDCYEAQFGSLVPDDSGVPLEHLVTCIKGVELVLNNYAGIKYLRKQDPNATVNNIQHSSDEGKVSYESVS